jgi:hypothetical protein
MSKLQMKRILVENIYPIIFSRKNILSCLLINSEAIELTDELFQLRLFILRIIKIYKAIIF